MNLKLDETQMRELAWRRPLTEAELARLEEVLQVNPDTREEWLADARLSEALRQLPQQPAPSNLAARVLAEIDRDRSARSLSQKSPWLLARWQRWAGGATALLLLSGGFWWQQHAQRLAAQQTKALTTFARSTEATQLPSAEALENFEVILRIHPEPLADMELLALGEKLAAMPSHP